MSKDTSGPAFPYEEQTSNGQPYQDHFGMTLRQYAAIKLKVADSGIDWLDEMITKSNRDAIATKAMQGLMGRVWGDSPAEELFAIWSRSAYALADAMLKARETK